MKIQKIDFNQVLFFAQRAKAAYTSETEIKKLFPNTLFVKELPDIKVQYFIEQDNENKEQIIVVRGTSNITNVKEDAEYIRAKDKNLNIYVHSGFDRDAMRVYSDMIPYLKNEYKISVTGHSLGAAIAVLLILYLESDHFTVNHSYNFGQPKVTNEDGVKKYAFLPVTRVVNKDDIVPLLPPKTLLDSIHGFYEHISSEVILLDDEYYIFLDQHNPEIRSAESFWGNIGDENFQDHHMDLYLKNIEAKLSQSFEIPYDQREKHLQATII